MKTGNLIRFGWVLLMLFLAIVACMGTNSPTPTSAPATTSEPVASTPAEPSSSNSGLSPVDLPSQRLDQASDMSSLDMAMAKRVAGGDRFVNGLYERPFNANTMDTYFPYIDIISTQGFKDDTWGYATITMAGADKDGHLSAEYAVELDLNKDGRGDWLIRASNPSSTTWTTQGVQAWKDSDGDVGGVIPMVADNNPSGGNGYETLVFDQGKGDLVDGAWTRIDPNDPNTVEIAFKLSMLGNPKLYAMGSWAGSNIDPATFDYNDHMTHADAGDPDPGYGVYPLKDLAETDNTCRLAIGFVPTTYVPGLCQVVIPKGQPAPPGVIVPTPGCTNFCKYGYAKPYPACICNIG